MVNPDVLVKPPFQGYNPADRRPVDFELPKISLADRLWLSMGIVVHEIKPSILIVDLSHWNGDIDPAALLASGVVAVIIKCSEGAEGTYYEYKDTKFEENYRKLLDYGFPVMLYHFFRGEKGSAEKSWFMKCADGFLNDPRVEGKTAVWLDCEWKKSSQSRASYTRRAFGFNSLITGEGMENGVYSSPGLVPSLFDPAEADWDSVNQWNAHWTRALKDTLPFGWSEQKRKVWQYSIYPTHDWAPTVNGAGTVDINHGYWYDASALRMWMGQEVYPTASPSPSPSPSPAADCCEEHDLRLDTIEAGMQVLTEIQQQQDRRIDENATMIATNMDHILANKQEIAALTGSVQSLSERVDVHNDKIANLDGSLAYLGERVDDHDLKLTMHDAQLMKLEELRDKIHIAFHLPLE